MTPIHMSHRTSSKIKFTNSTTVSVVYQRSS
jgi:hypothetical protein